MINNITLEYCKKKIICDLKRMNESKKKKNIKILFFYRIQKFKKKYL